MATSLIEGGDHGFSVPILSQQLGARRLGGAAQPAPDIELESKKVEEDGGIAALAAGSAGDGKLSAARLLTGGYIGADPEVWILIRPCDAEIGAGRIDASDGIPEIVVLGQRRSDQCLQFFIVENLEPLELGNRVRLRSCGGSAAKYTRRCHRRSLVVRADQTAAQPHCRCERCENTSESTVLL